LNITIDTLRCSKPGYNLLRKRRSKVNRIIEIPEKLNKKILQIEAHEKKHFIYKSGRKSKKLIEEDVPLIYKHTSPYE
jgi:hypothetical protein